MPPTKGSYRGPSGNQGNQQGYGSEGNIKYLPRAGGTDKSGKKPAKSSQNKATRLARTGRA